MAVTLKWCVFCVGLIILLIFEIIIFKVFPYKSILLFPKVKEDQQARLKAQGFKRGQNVSEDEIRMYVDYLKAKSVLQDEQCKKLYGNSKLIQRSSSNLDLNSSKSLQIFWWGNFFNSEPPIEKNQKVLNKNCPQYGCTLTNELSLYNESDAVIFHLPDLERMKLPYKAMEQRWILMVLESPISYTIPDILELKDKFNWTASYMYHSDINLLYYAYRPLTELEKSNQTKLMDFYTGKRKKILWTASNCMSGSIRKVLVNKLQKLGWEIDIYGKCGNLTCSVGEKCETQLGSDYMFYLAFENSLCVDYITEKPARALKWGTIPIVYGWGNYSTFLPPHSYIDTKMFDSIEKLSEFMHQVADSRDLYNSFFTWRKKFTHKKSLGLSCGICKRLYMDRTIQYYTNIHLWWDANRLCKQFWKVANYITMNKTNDDN